MQDTENSSVIHSKPIPPSEVIVATPDNRFFRAVLAAPFIAVIAFAAWWLLGSDTYGLEAAFTVVAGACFGIILQRSRFCFFCIIREAIQERKFEGSYGILVALGVGTVGSLVVFQGWIRDPSAGFLPPDAHIGPVAWPMLLGSFVFGLGMAFSGSCISAHFYRLGEGSWLSVLAILGALVGFGIGFSTWNTFYLRAYQDAPELWIPEHLGYAGALGAILVTLLLLGRILQAIERAKPPQPEVIEKNWYPRFFERKWPTWIGGAAVGLLATYVTLRTEALGVTAELGRLSREAWGFLGLIPDRLEGLDGFRGCATAPVDQLLSSNALFVLSLIAGSFAVSFLGGHFEVERQPWRRLPLAFAGGIMLGFGAMISLGCTVGTLYSGITAGAVSGWIFLVGCIPGIALGLLLRRFLGWEK